MGDEKQSQIHTRQDLRVRTREYALTIIRLYTSLPKSTEAQILGKQVIRSGTSVGAHYREGFRAKSDPDFINKIQGALQELEETAYWLELLLAAEIIALDQFQPLYKETSELIAMFTTIQVKVKSRQ